MASHFQPSEDHVNLLLELVCQAFPRQEAIARLKGNNNNVEQALNEYYDTGSSGNNKYRWDEGQFNSDRDGESSNHGISFDIHAPDDPGPFGNRFDGAPSRPPSRTSNNKSPLSKVIDLTTEHAAADPRNSINHGYNTDSDLEQALAASRADLGMPPQESGITGTEEVHFGPATRSQYEQGQWEMVPLGRTSAQEILVDPEPANRKREPDAPAFLKPSIQDHRLNAIITIYHEIPLTRALFLRSKPTDALLSFGYDAEWWSGKAIEQQPIVSVDGSEQECASEVNRELQRLMAFLDKTERSYGSVEALAGLREVKKALQSGSDTPAAVLSAWRRVFEDDPDMIRTIFSTGVAHEDSEHDPRHFAILELDLPAKDSCQETLYDIADEVLWPGMQVMDLDRCPYLSRIAEVIAFRVEGGDDRKNIEIPIVWYPDRYLKAGRQAALDMRIRKNEVDQELQRIRVLEEKLTYVPLRTGKIVKVQELFKAALKHDDAEIKDSEHLVDADIDMLASHRQTNAASGLSDELRKIVASIDKKLLALELAKEKALQEMRAFSKLYTEPLEDTETPALHKYTLRGVSASKSTMFICRQAAPDLIQMDADGAQDQWWRIHYAPVGYKPVVVEKTTEDKVLEAARETKNAILVYASEEAMKYRDHNTEALPRSLETFVKFDNRTFNSEFNESEDSQTISRDSPASVDDTLPDSNPYAQVNITARELRNDGGYEEMSTSPLRQQTSTGGLGLNSSHDDEVIIGVDPFSTPETPPASQEMQERSGMPMLSSRPRANVTQPSTLDSMDLDQIMEDNAIASESAAVKRVGFAP